MKNDFNITKALIDLSTDSIFIMQNGIIKYANQNLLQVSGYILSELIGVKFTEFVPTDELEKVYSIFLKRQSGENIPTKYESSAKLKNGKFIDVEVSVVSIVFEGENALQVVLRDITKRKAAERKYQNIIDFAPIGFYQTSRTGDFLLVNKELANILGYQKSDELLSKNISDFYFSVQEREKLIEKYDTKKSSEVKNVEVKFRKKDGTAIWVLMTARAIKDENYETISYDGFIIDISERKNHELHLLNRIEIEEIINEISTLFAQGIYLDTDKHILTAIKKIGLFTQVDRVYIFQFENNGTLLTNTYEWCNDGVEPQIDNLQHLPVDIFPWWMDKLNKFEIINYEFIADFPVEAKAEKKVLEEQGIISILVLPMIYEGQLIGFVGFDSVKTNKKWIEHDIKVLETLSGLISGVISRAKRIYELKRAKTLAEEGQKRYKSLFYENSLVMLLIDPKTGDIVDANNTACNYYGYSNQQITSLKITQINTLSEAEIQVKMKKALNTERQHFEFKHRLASGEIRDVESYSGKLSVAGNDLLYSIVHDVTERKLAEAKVLKLSSAIEQSPISILITDTTGSIEYVNPYISQLTGYSPEELLGNNPSILNSGIQSSQFYKKLWDTILKGEIWEGEMCNKKKNGELFWELAKISPIIDSKGEITHFVGIKEDITERRSIENKIRFLADSLEHVGECVSITDKEDIILYVNRAFCVTYGYSNTELLGQHIGILQPDNIQQSELMQLFKETRKGNWKGELINKRKDNSLFPILLSTSKIIDEKKNEIAYIGVAMDITEMKKSRSELIAAKEKAEESDRLKSAFLANMSHEIRTPMNGILGFTSLLLEPDLSDETKEQYIQIIHQSGERMLNTVSDIVEISKIEAGIIDVRKSEINVNEVIRSIHNFFQVQTQKKGLNLIYQNENLETDIILTTDKTKFESIITNLVKNAIKFTEKGNITVSCCFKNGFIKFCVKDTGIGIPKHRQAAIFNRFEQADIEDTRVFEGSGLGLAIAKSYVEMLGGEIWVESTEGQGSEFCFTIPNFIIEKDKASNSKPDNKEKRSKRQCKVLIVEDDETSAIYLKTILNDITEKITHVNSGERAIEECKNQADFDVILMDIKMPGISGYEATKRIREFNKDVIIIAQTAYALSGDREQAISSGCNDYITKPVKRNEILEKIEKNIKNSI